VSKVQRKCLSSIKGNNEIDMLRSSKMTLDKEEGGYS
jgi:hypothetical protein